MGTGLVWFDAWGYFWKFLRRAFQTIILIADGGQFKVHNGSTPAMCAHLCIWLNKCGDHITPRKSKEQKQTTSLSCVGIFKRMSVHLSV